MQVLVLGGTGDAIQLINQLAMIPNLKVINSLAGRTREPSRAGMPTRIGGFGGVDGLVHYLKTEMIDIVIDATHPFASQISFNAAAAAQACGLPHIMLVRPQWEPLAGDRWLVVDSINAAVTILPKVAKRVFLTIGRQEIAAFSNLAEIWFLMRMIDPPAPSVKTPKGELLLAKGPFSLIDERELLNKHQIEAIVSKNSGGEATYAKIVAARELSLPVVMIQRPPLPNAKKVTDVASILQWLSIINSSS